MTRKSAQKTESTIGFDQIIRNFAGIPLKIDNEQVTLKRLAVDALLGNYPDEQLTGDEKAFRYQLAKRIHTGRASLTSSEREVVRALIGKNFIPLLVGAAFEMLATPDECAHEPATFPKSGTVPEHQYCTKCQATLPDDDVAKEFERVADELAAVSNGTHEEHA